MLQLMHDLHPLFTYSFLHCVDSDKILSCEVFQIAEKTAMALESPNLATPMAMMIHDGLSEDAETNDVTATITKEDDSIHTFTLMTKVTRHNTLEKIKQDLLTVKDGGSSIIILQIDHIQSSFCPF